MKHNYTNLCVKNLPLNFEKQDLVGLCDQFGPIQSAKVMFDLKTGKSKGFGFVRFHSPLSAAMAKDKLNGIWVIKTAERTTIGNQLINNGKKINVSYAISEENMGLMSNEIIISSLPLYFDKKDIFDLFAKYGKITSIQLINDNEKKIFHGKAVVSYRTKEEALAAFKNLNNIKLSNDSWPLYIQFLNNCYDAEPKTQINISKKSMYENSYQIKYGIEIQKPTHKNSNCNICANLKKTPEYTPNDEIFRNKQLENYMFKSIAEDE